MQADDAVTAAYTPDPQVLPEWLSYSTYLTTIDGTIYTTETVLQLPLTYYGPPIPLDSAWTYGGLTSPASSAAATSTASQARASTTIASVSTSPPLVAPTRSVPSTSTPVGTATGTSAPSPVSDSIGLTTIIPASTTSGVAAASTASPQSISSLLLSVLLPVLLVLLIVGIIASCVLLRRQRRRRRAAGASGSYALAASGQGPPPEEASQDSGRAAAEVRRSDETEYESLPDDPVLGPPRKRWIQGALPSGIALRSRTASARGRVASNDAWTEDIHPESSSLMGGSEQDRTQGLIGARPLVLPPAEVADDKPAAVVAPSTDSPPAERRLSLLARLGMFIKPGPSSRTSKQDKHASLQSSTPSAQLTIATLPSATQDTSGTSSNPIVPGDPSDTPHSERLFFSLPQPPSTPPASAREGGTAMPGMGALASVPQRHHFSFIYPDRLSEESETPSDERLAQLAPARFPLTPVGPPGGGDLGESYLGDRMLRPLEPRRWTASSATPTDYFSLPPSPPVLTADGGTTASSRATVERYIDTESDPRPVSITAVGGGAYLSQPTASPSRGVHLAGSSLTPPEIVGSGLAPDASSPIGRMSLFGGTAPSLASDERNRFSAVSYPGAPMVGEAAYRQAMGLAPGQGGQDVPAVAAPTVSSGGYEADRDSARQGVAWGMSRKSRMASEHSGDPSSPWHTGDGLDNPRRQNYGDFGEPLRYLDVASNSATILEQPPAIRNPDSAQASMHSHHSCVPSDSVGDYDEESAGATYSAAALRGRRSMPQLLPASRAVPAFAQSSRDAPPTYDYAQLRPAPDYPRPMERAPSHDQVGLMQTAGEGRRERRSRFGRFW